MCDDLVNSFKSVSGSIPAGGQLCSFPLPSQTQPYFSAASGQWLAELCQRCTLQQLLFSCNRICLSVLRSNCNVFLKYVTNTFQSVAMNTLEFSICHVLWSKSDKYIRIAPHTSYQNCPAHRVFSGLLCIRSTSQFRLSSLLQHVIQLCSFKCRHKYKHRHKDKSKYKCISSIGHFNPNCSLNR